MYGLRSKNSSGSADRSAVSASTNVPASTSCSIRSRALTGKWWPHGGRPAGAPRARRRDSASRTRDRCSGAASRAAPRARPACARSRRRSAVSDICASVRPRPGRVRLQPGARRQSRRATAGSASRSAGEADARERARRAASIRAGSPRASSSVGPPGSGMKQPNAPGCEHVDVECDVDRGRSRRVLARRRRRSRSPQVLRSRADRGSAHPRARRLAARRRPRRSPSAAASPTRCPDGDVSGVLRSPWASSQTTASAPASRRQAPDRADVRAAAAAEDDRRAGRFAPVPPICASRVSSSTTAASG